MNLPSSILAALSLLQKARAPEEVFGPDGSAIQDVYRDFAKIVHEDLAPAPDKAAAHEAFILLTKTYEQAQDKVARGTYGDGKASTVAILRTKTAAYHLGALMVSDDIADLYEAVVEGSGDKVLVRLVRSAANNDLMKAESDTLTKVKELITDPKLLSYFPALIDSFEVGVGKTRKRANVFAWKDGLVSLKRVHEAYPKGLDPRDAAWMFNRQLEALHILHSVGYVFGALTPDRFLINPVTHEGLLFDFSYSVKVGGLLKAVSNEWSAHYPDEVFLKSPVDCSSDVYMAARNLNYLVLNDMPAPIAALLKACSLGRAYRIPSARAVHDDFKTTLVRLYGPKSFRVFEWPPKKGA